MFIGVLTSLNHLDIIHEVYKKHYVTNMIWYFFKTYMLGKYSVRYRLVLQHMQIVTIKIIPNWSFLFSSKELTKV